MYSTDPYLPGLTMNEANCLKFFKRLEIPVKVDGRFRHWVDLSNDERKVILSELMELMLSKGVGHKNAKRLFAEVYTLPEETIGTPIHDAKEFATLLNSCGKYDRPETGYELCRGDRGKHYDDAMQLLKGHRNILMDGMQYVKDQGIIDHGSIQYFDAGDRIPDNIVGTIASMLLNNSEVDNNKPLFGFAISEDGQYLKVSGRSTRELVDKGLNLSKVMRRIAEQLGGGGAGGGHDIAAGATIPIGTLKEFLMQADQIVKKQVVK